MLTTMETSIWVRKILRNCIDRLTLLSIADEWLNVINDIIGGLKEKNEFPEWYEGLHRALYRANEFLGKMIYS